MSGPETIDAVLIEEIEQKLLLEAIFLRYQHDFRHYAPDSMRRRLQAAQERLNCANLSQLQERILHQPHMFAELMRYLTVQVTEMFRDPEYFALLRTHVIPVLRTYPSLKIWVAGCSTGEEVWSLAILLEEEGLLERTILYATDINIEALKAAESGVVAIGRLAKYSENYLAAGGRASLSDYYVTQDTHALLRQSFKKQMVFADHSLATDSVFSEMHLISCRNVMIYFDKPLQARALALFRESLVHRGFLGIGPKENLSATCTGDDFEELDRGVRIYQKR